MGRNPRYRALASLVVRGRRQVDGDDAAGVGIEPGHGFDKNTVSLAEKSKRVLVEIDGGDDCREKARCRAFDRSQAGRREPPPGAEASVDADEAAGLVLPEARIEAAMGEQLGMRAAFGDVACPAPPGGPCAQWSTGGGRWRSPSCPASGSPGFLDRRFDFRVQRRGRFVEDQDRRVLEQHRAMAMRWRWPPRASLRVRRHGRRSRGGPRRR